MLKGITDSTDVAYDRKGFCKNHPQTRLRKRNAIGQWKTLLDRCPLCAVTQMCNAAQKSRGPNMDLGAKNSYHLHRKLQQGKKRGSRDDRSVSSCTASTTSLSRSSSSSDRSHSQPSPASKCDTHVVCGMMYTCPYTLQKGHYTGEVDDHTEVPHGVGTLRCEDGTFAEGEWRFGKLTTEFNSQLKATIQERTTHQIEAAPARPIHPSQPERKKSVRFEDQEIGNLNWENSLYGSDLDYDADCVTDDGLDDSNDDPRPVRLTRSCPQSTALYSDKTVKFSSVSQPDFENSLLGQGMNFTDFENSLFGEGMNFDNENSSDGNIDCSDHSKSSGTYSAREEKGQAERESGSFVGSRRRSMDQPTSRLIFDQTSRVWRSETKLQF